MLLLCHLCLAPPVLHFALTARSPSTCPHSVLPLVVGWLARLLTMLARCNMLLMAFLLLGNPTIPLVPRRLLQSLSMPLVSLCLSKALLANLHICRTASSTML